MKELDELKKVFDLFIYEIGINDCFIKILVYFRIWVVDMIFYDSYLFKLGKGIV